MAAGIQQKALGFDTLFFYYIGIFKVNEGKYFARDDFAQMW